MTRLPKGGDTPARVATVAFALAAEAVAVLIGGGLFTVRHRPAEIEVTNRPVQISEDGYVSSQTCQACHPQQYASWHQSFHRTMTQVPAAETVVSDFNGVDVNAVRGRPMHLERRADEFWATFDDPDSRRASRQAPQIARQVVLMTGSHQQQQYWFATGRHRLISKLPAV